MLVAPSISAGARALFAGKQNVRVLEVPIWAGDERLDFKRVGGGLLVQTQDAKNVGAGELRVVTKLRHGRPSWTTCCSPGRWPSS